jgi:hypothetical protein
MSHGRRDGMPVNASPGVLDVLDVFASVDAEPSEESVEPVPAEPAPVASPDDPVEALVLAGTVVVVVVEDVDVLAGAAVNEMATVHPDSESVVSAAVNVTDSGVMSVTSNTAFPSLSL